MSETIKTALIGYGKSAKYFHVPLLKASTGFKVHSVLQRTKNDSKLDFPNAKIVRDLKDLLKDDQLDLVIITSPNHFHYDQVFDALCAEKDVVVEKPFTVTSGGAEKLIQLAERKNRLLTVYQNRRLDGDFLTVKRLIKNNAVGEIVEFESSYNRFRNYLQDDAWKEKDLPGSGILYDLSPHLIDQAILLFGEPKRVFADIRSQRGGDADDCFEIDLYYPTMKVKLKAGMLVPEPTPRFVLRGKSGTFVKYGMDPQENLLAAGKNPQDEDWGSEPESRWGTLYRLENGKIKEEKIETEKGNYLQYYHDLKYAFHNRKEPPVNPETAKKGIQIIEKSIESSREGRIVDFS